MSFFSCITESSPLSFHASHRLPTNSFEALFSYPSFEPGNEEEDDEEKTADFLDSHLSLLFIPKIQQTSTDAAGVPRVSQPFPSDLTAMINRLAFAFHRHSFWTLSVLQKTG